MVGCDDGNGIVVIGSFYGVYCFVVVELVCDIEIGVGLFIRDVE